MINKGKRIKKQKTKDKRQKTKDKRQKTKDKRQKTKDKRQKTKDKRQKTRTRTVQQPRHQACTGKRNVVGSVDLARPTHSLPDPQRTLHSPMWRRDGADLFGATSSAMIFCLVASALWSAFVLAHRRFLTRCDLRGWRVKDWASVAPCFSAFGVVCAFPTDGRAVVVASTQAKLGSICDSVSEMLDPRCLTKKSPRH